MIHLAAEQLVLYSFRRCPYAIRARLALAVSGQAYELRDIKLKDKPPELLAVSPKATVPVLVLPDGTVIEESLEIMLWALRQNDSAEWLAPQHASLEQMLVHIVANDGSFKHHLDRYKYPNRFPAESAGDLQGFAMLQRAGGEKWLRELEAMLVDGWLYGTAASLADMALLPFVRQFAHTEADWFAAQPWPLVQSWLQGFEASALFNSVMQKPSGQAPQFQLPDLQKSTKQDH